MYLIRSFTLILLTIIGVISKDDSRPKATIVANNKGKKVAHIHNQKYQFAIDTAKYRVNLGKMVNFIENVSYDSITIEKGIVVGDSNQTYYALIGYDSEYHLKTARWLIEDKDTLYLHRNTGKNVNNEIFYRTFFSVYGSDTDCYPSVLKIDDVYYWTSNDSGKLYCDPNSPCKTTSTFLPYE